MADKKITDLQLRSGVDEDVNLPADDGIQTYRVTAPQIKTFVLGKVVDPTSIWNYSIAASVASSALTIALKDAAGNNPSAASPVNVYFRPATIGSGASSLVSHTSSLSTVISSGSTAGHQSAKAEYLYLYAINNAGALELAWSSTGGRDEGKVYSTTAEGGAGAADSRTVLYSTTARSNVAIRFLGRFITTQSTAGTWAAVPTEIALNEANPGLEENEVWYTRGVSGTGSTNTSVLKFDTSRRVVGDAMTPAYSAANGFSCTVNRRGLYMIMNCVSPNAGDIYGITRNSSDLTGTMNALPYGEVLAKGIGNSSSYPITQCVPVWCEVDDVIRVQTESAGSFGASPSHENNHFRMVKIG